MCLCVCLYFEHTKVLSILCKFLVNFMSDKQNPLITFLFFCFVTFFEKRKIMKFQVEFATRKMILTRLCKIAVGGARASERER